MAAVRSAQAKQSFFVSASAFFSLVYSLVVRDLRTEHKNAALGILISVAQPLIAGLVFYLFLKIMGQHHAPIRGDQVTYVLTGFILFFIHVRTVGAVSGALRRDMLNHQRMSPFLMINIKAISSLYKNVFALLILMAMNYLLRGLWIMNDLLLFICIVLLAWAGGVAIGMICMALARYLSWGGIVTSTYLRISFFTSGKFFVANSLPANLRPYFDWNPIFHLIDQARGALFLNYTPHTTSMSYAFYVFAALTVIGFLVEHHVRIHYNASHDPS